MIDPIEEAERFTGKKIDTDKRTQGLAFYLNMRRGQAMKKIAVATKDTHYSMTPEYLKELLAHYGLVEVWHEDFAPRDYKGRIDKGRPMEREFVYLAPRGHKWYGVIVYWNTYRSTSFNSGGAWWFQDCNTQENFSKIHCRLGISGGICHENGPHNGWAEINWIRKCNLSMLSDEFFGKLTEAQWHGDFLHEWCQGCKELPWIINYAEEKTLLKEMGFEGLVRSKLKRMPLEVSRIVNLLK